MDARRLDRNPILTPALDERIGENINGPSLIRAPGWLDDPLGEYYLYFASHTGEYIRLAHADELTGPWTVHSSGALPLERAGGRFDDHVASPDVHVDAARRRLRMYYHGCCAPFEDEVGQTDQFTRLALSSDGLTFEGQSPPLGRFYFRVFEYDGAHSAFAKENHGDGEEKSGQRVYRSRDGLSNFERGPLLFRDGSRHTALRRSGGTLDVLYSRIGDAPEHILHATIDLTEEWTQWKPTAPRSLLEPDRDWEGAGKPIEPSSSGGVTEPVCQLRDPAIYTENGTTYLLYTVAGERGIAIAELLE